MRAGALHHVGILEATSVSLPASLPWVRIRDTINLSQDLTLKHFILAWNNFSTQSYSSGFFSMWCIHFFLSLSARFKLVDRFNMIETVHSAP